MRPIHANNLFVLLIVTLLIASSTYATVYISEIMADNDGVLLDADGDKSDWIELYNDSSNAVSLSGWYLTDNPTNLTQWAFPATNISAKGFLVVFASDKDRAVAGDELHTNFKLSASGEYVALVRSDGTTIESAFNFPAQLEDVSWGYGFADNSTTTTATLVTAGAACSAHVPTSSGDSAGWQQLTFDDSSWQTGTTGVGYERSSGYESYIGLDVESQMYNQNASVYIRIPFVYTGDPVDTLRLRMKYDDGFVAYLNGTQIATANASGIPSWNSTSTSYHDDSLAVLFQTFASSNGGALQSGNNVLSIHGLNQNTVSSDVLFVPELESVSINYGTVAIEPTEVGMISLPTPGTANKSVYYTGYCETPSIYPEHGIYEAPFQIAISNITDGAVIRYTLDGSTPTESSSIYSGPIPISGTTLLRASAFKGTFKPSVANTQTYLFIADVLQQDNTVSQPFGDWGHAGADWAVDPSMTNAVITDSEGGSFQLADALLDLPTVSLVTDWDNWWSDEDGPVLPDGVIPWLGIYADPVGENAVRRPVSMEYFTSDGSASFAEPGVVSVVGGGIGGTSAERWKTDKLSLRVAFTDKLNYPVFGDDAAEKFNGLVLDAHLGFTWTSSFSWAAGQRAHPKFLTDAVASDLQNGMSGKGAPHSKFVHLYLNGLYWGLYDMHERPDEHFAAEYFGGQNEDYDSVKHWSDDSDSADSDHDGDPYNDNLTNGDDADLNDLLANSRAGLSSLASYQAMEARLDIDGLIDYLLVNFFLGNNDWAHKNWYVTHNHADPNGVWRYHSWDVEHVYEVSMSDFDVAGAVNCDVTGKNGSGGPTEIHQDLTANAEYRLRFADHIHNHFFNGGILTTETSTSMFWNRVLEMERGMLGEAARWADSVPDEGHDWQEWYDHMTDLRDIYYPSRSGVVFNQLKSRGLYPDTSAPEFLVNGVRRHGGLVVPGDSITIDSSNTVYYTTDGTDPRAVGGAVAGSLYSGPLSFSQPTILKARARNGSEWSALCEAVFLFDEVPLAVTELMYHAADSNQQDFIEIRNISSESVNLYGYKLDRAIDYSFKNSAVSTLAPGEFLVAIKDIDGFNAAYATNGIAISGEYKGDFDNNGEKVQLEFWNHDLITFRYSDARNWPQAADGAGHSLVALESAIPDEEQGSLNYGGNWRASTYIGGSPGYADPVPSTTVVLNEITAHTDTGEDPPFESNDQIELYNPTASDITLNGWYLSDDLGELQKWAIPAGTVVPSHGFVLFDEDDFHSARITGFGLNKAGEEVVLSMAGRVVDTIRFKGQENGASLGRYPDGSDHWVITLPTPSAANQLAPDSVWISRIMYNPAIPSGYADSDVLEYIQLENRSGATVSLETAAGAWRIDGGVSFTFPDSFSMTAGEKLWLVSFDPANTVLLNLFCSTYGLNAASETILGPYKGQLSNEGERVAVERPQESDDPLKPLDVSWVVVDELFYFNQSPWPADADGTGYPLIRSGLTLWGVPTPDDTDADQLDDDWENLYFGSLSQSGSDDPDNDLFSNLEESICGTNPTNGLSYFAIEDMQAPSISWTAVTGRTYSVYWTDDLQQPFTQIAWGIDYPQNSFSDTLHSTNNCNYYYISVEMQ